MLDVGGSARGPLTRLAPHARLLGGAIVLASGLISPVETWPGALCGSLLTTSWLLACRPPARLVLTLLGLGCLLFAPVFLLLPWLPGTDAGAARVLVLWGLFARGLMGMLVSVATVTTLRADELYDGLVALPLPRLVTALLLQIVNQLGQLGAETARIAAALAVRGATGGWRATWRVSVALPSVWLPRVVQRAERVSDAMEVRGHDALPPLFRETSLRGWDRLMLALAGVGLAAALLLRLAQGWT